MVLSEGRITRAACFLLKCIRGAMSWMVIILFLYMIIAIFVQILGRYLFDFAINVAVESATLAQIWMVLIGAGVAMRRNQHVGVDVVVALCPRVGQKILIAIAAALALWFLWVVLRGGLVLMELGANYRTSSMRLPLDIAYSILPVGIAYFALEFILATIPRLVGTSDDLNKAHEDGL